MNTICFATNNQNKLREIQQIIGGSYEIISLDQLGCKEELLENQDTLEGNSLQKAQYVHDQYSVDVFADDTGLEIDALNGAPGVYSARYAGPQRSSEDNMLKVLTELENASDRRARFRTVITLIQGNQINQFDGVVEGVIAFEKKGGGGFGYDPIFIPEGCHQTFSEMTAVEKNQISHRKRAIEKLVNFLNGQG